MRKGSIWLNAFLLLLFATLSYVGIIHHELWFDEANDWLMVRSSGSFTELMHTGHPLMWSGLLYTLSHLTSNPFAMQLLNISISLIAALIFLRYAPFSILIKICILFSYFFFFEYNIISRSYGITWLLLTIFCALFCSKQRNYFLLILLLVLLANTHAFSLLISLVLFAVTLHSYKQEKGWNKKTLLIGCALFAAGLLFSIITMLPHPNNLIVQQSTGNYFSVERVSKTISFFIKGLYPLPDFLSYHFWNSNFIVSHIKIVGIFLTPLIFIIPLILFYDKRYSLAVFYTPALLVMAFMFKFQLFTGVHYMGYAFMLLIVSLWLASGAEQSRKLQLSEVLTTRLGKLRTLCYTPFITSILVCQLAAGIYAFCIDYRYPFSEGKEVSSYINSQVDKNSLVIVWPFYTGSSIGIYLNKPIFYPDENKICSFTPLDVQPIGINKIWERIRNTMDTTAAKHILIVFAYSGDTLKTLQQYISELHQPYSIQEIKEFNEGIVRGENYVVYEIEKK